LSKLVIYRASAGAGKTYTLTKDYIDLLIELPGNHEHILAVTFTNKATEEMKSRILGRLHEICQPGKSEMRQYFMEKYKLDEDRTKDRAKLILKTILHNYSRFHVGTIDSFFQNVIRSFAREIDLPAAYRIEMDIDKVLSGAIDRMLYGLSENEQLLHWLVTYTHDRISEGKAWKINESIARLGKELFKEVFQQHEHILSEKIADKAWLHSYRSELNRIKNSYLEEFKKYGKEAVQVISGYGLTEDDFYRKSGGIANFLTAAAAGLKDMPSEAVCACLDNIDRWIPKDSHNRTLMEQAYAELDPILGNIIELYNRDYPLYKSAETILKHIYLLGILTDLLARIYEYTGEQDIFLISDTARFLKEIIEGNDTSFIYEKTGSYLDYFMIDEFQDTSGFQWLNLKPLIRDSLSMDHRSMVVGDIKQSIYRWRNSNWEILSEQVSSSFDPSVIKTEKLGHNRRSQERIISFNNDFFSAAGEIIAELVSVEEDPAAQAQPYPEKVRAAYADVVQLLPADKAKGHGTVRIDLVPEKGEQFYELADGQVIEILEMLSGLGYRQKDIALLVRKKKDAERLTDLLLQFNSSSANTTGQVYQVLSDESLYLSHSPAVRFIIHALRWMSDPADRLNHAALIYNHSLLTGGELPPESYEDLFLPRDGGTSEKTGNTEEKYVTAILAGLKGLPLNELIEEMIRRCGISGRNEHAAFLAVFQDQVLEYSRDGMNDIGSFLEWWEITGINKALTISEDQEAIRIMTIHKAKGLQFKAVIIPYCNWKLDHEKFPVMWFNPVQHPFNTLPVVPVTYSSGLKDTVFRDQYFEERFRVHVDQLNLLYVACTRAVDVLCVIVPSPPGNEGKMQSVTDLFTVILSEEKFMTGFSEGCSHGGRRWQSGEMEIPGQEKQAVPRHFLQLHKQPSFMSRGRLVMRTGNLDVFDPEAVMKIDRGRVMHRIFEHIRTAADVEAAVLRLAGEGKVAGAEKDALVAEIKELLGTAPLDEWFSGSWKVMNEQDILTPGGQVYRPDRIMTSGDRMVLLDYKFGVQKAEAHAGQVQSYQQLLQEMGYADVQAYLWYVNLKELVPVEPIHQG
jgi:ATP-dependent exoDNAse (exonuclease V) beta subunit